MKQFHLLELLCRRDPHWSAKLPFDLKTNRIKNSPLHIQPMRHGILKSVPATKVNVNPRKEDLKSNLTELHLS